MLQTRKKNNILSSTNSNDGSAENVDKKAKTKTKVKAKSTKKIPMINEIEFFFENSVKGIQGTYGADLDLSQMYALVLDCLEYNEKEFLPSLEEGITAAKKEYEAEKDSLSIIEKKAMMREIDEMQLYIDFFHTSVQSFEKATKTLIENYNTLEKIEYIDFKSELFKKKHILINQFIDITKKYIPLNLTLSLNLKSPCLCLKTKTFQMVNGSKMCPVCKVEINVYDTNRVAAIPKTAYDDWSIFYIAIQNFQGIHSKTLPADLEEKLDEYFSEQNLPVGREIRKQSVIENGKKAGTSRTIMQEALIAIKYENYLGDLLLIMSNYWGWILPNIDRHIAEIYDKYEQSKTFYHLYKADRKSSLGAQFRLFQILYSMGFDVDASDFKLVMTPQLQQEYNEIWSRVATSLGWKWKQL